MARSYRGRVLLVPRTEYRADVSAPEDCRCRSWSSQSPMASSRALDDIVLVALMQLGSTAPDSLIEDVTAKDPSELTVGDR